MFNLTAPKIHTPAPPQKTWQLWEADLLVNSALKRQLVTAYLETTGETCQTFIHGFDLDHNELLLDGLFPRTDTLSHPVLAPRLFWLQICGPKGLYNLKVELMEVLGEAGCELLSVQVLDAGLADNRRWRKRVYFDRHQGPKVELQLANHAIINGHIANLSNQGALIEVFGENLKATVHLGNTLRTSLLFNRNFTLSLRATLKQYRYLRSPYCHNQLRVQFQLMSAENRGELDSFIDSIAHC